MDDKNDKVHAQLTRRAAVAGLALGASGLAGARAAGRSSRSDALDMDTADGNCRALIKLQADLSGRQTMGGFPGSAWAWVPGEGNFHLFNTYGVGVSRVEYRPDESAWRFYHREVLLYLDPKTNEILESWRNPWTERQLEVLHIQNEHVNRYYSLKPDARFAFPFPYETNGDDLVFRVSSFQLEDNVMSPADYPLHAQSGKYQASELWGIIGSLSEVMDPDVSSAHCVTSWARISSWLPFMEMGNRPGQMVYHSHAYKLMQGASQLPVSVRSWLESKAPEYFEAPAEWAPPSTSISAWTYSKEIIDERRARELTERETPFSWRET